MLHPRCALADGRVTLRVCLSVLELGVAGRLTEVGGKQMR